MRYRHYIAFFSQATACKGMYISTFQSDSYLELLTEELTNKAKSCRDSRLYGGLIHELSTTFNNATIYLMHLLTCYLWVSKLPRSNVLEKHLRTTSSRMLFCSFIWSLTSLWRSAKKQFPYRINSIIRNTVYPPSYLLSLSTGRLCCGTVLSPQLYTAITIPLKPIRMLKM